MPAVARRCGPANQTAGELGKSGRRDSCADRRKVEDRTETTVWEVARDAAAAYEHPTQKPVELVARSLRNSTVAGELVLDIFAGSGSTLIAAAKLARRALLIEKDPGYCDVIRQRWERFQAKVQRA